MSRHEHLKLSGIRRKEQLLAERLLPSSTTSRAVRFVFGLPDEVAGITTVDLAAGGCSLTADLLTDGANAYAVDCLYSNAKQLSRRLDEATEKVINRLPPDRKAEMRKSTREGIERFWQSFKNHPERYISAWLTEVSLPTDFADLVISFNGISDLTDFDVAKETILEGIRVTKPGKTFAFAPFHTHSGFHSQNSFLHRRIFEWLQAAGLGDVTLIEPSTEYFDKVLTFVKNKN